MSTIRCDNAECVVYVDELARRRPQQFELEVDTWPLCAVPHRAPSEERALAAPDGCRVTTGVQRAVLDEGAAEARHRATRPAPRPGAPGDRQAAAYAVAVSVARAREKALMSRRLLRCAVARAARAVLDPGVGAGVGAGVGGLAGRLASVLVGAASGGRPAGARGRRGPCSS